MTDLIAALEAADRMADWIEDRHATAHDIVSIELGVADDGEECDGCRAVFAYRKARADQRDV